MYIQETMHIYNFKGVRYDVEDKLGFLEATVKYALRIDGLKDQFVEYLKGILEEQ